MNFMVRPKNFVGNQRSHGYVKRCSDDSLTRGSQTEVFVGRRVRHLSTGDENFARVGRDERAHDHHQCRQHNATLESNRETCGCFSRAHPSALLAENSRASREPTRR